MSQIGTPSFFNSLVLIVLIFAMCKKENEKIPEDPKTYLGIPNDYFNGQKFILTNTYLASQILIDTLIQNPKCGDYNIWQFFNDGNLVLSKNPSHCISMDTVGLNNWKFISTDKIKIENNMPGVPIPELAISYLDYDHFSLSYTIPRDYMIWRFLRVK